MSWKHDDLQADLAKHLLIPERMVWQNMQIGPAGSPRPDVYTISKSYSNPKPISYEIKVSKSDFLSDMKTGKWQNYLQFSCAVVFCVPKGLVTKADIPAGCGLMIRGDDGWTTVKAPKLEKVTVPYYCMMKLLIDGAERMEKSHIKKCADEFTLYNSLRKKFGGLIARILDDHQSVENQINNEKSQLEYRLQEAEKRRKSIIDDAKNEAHQITQMRLELIECLGLKEDAYKWQIERAIKDLKNSLSESETLKQAIQSLTNCNNQINHSLDSLKQLTGEK